MTYTHTSEPSESGHGYYRDHHFFEDRIQSVEITFTYTNPLLPRLDELLRIDFSITPNKSKPAKSMEYYPDGRLYGVASAQGQQAVDRDEKSDLIDLVRTMMGEAVTLHPDNHNLLTTILTEMRTVPLLQFGDDRKYD